MAARLGVHRQWLYSMIYRGALQLDRDPDTGLYLFSRDPKILEQLRQLKDGLIHNINLSTEHQDA